MSTQQRFPHCDKFTITIKLFFCLLFFFFNLLATFHVYFFPLHTCSSDGTSVKQRPPREREPYRNSLQRAVIQTNASPLRKPQRNHQLRKLPVQPQSPSFNEHPPNFLHVLFCQQFLTGQRSQHRAPQRRERDRARDREREKQRNLPLSETPRKRGPPPRKKRSVQASEEGGSQGSFPCKARQSDREKIQLREVKQRSATTWLERDALLDILCTGDLGS